MPINSPLAPKKPKVDASGQLFSGMITDAAGRKQYYRNGEHVAGPQEAAAPKVPAAAPQNPQANPPKQYPKSQPFDLEGTDRPTAPKQPRQVNQAKVADYAKQLQDKFGDEVHAKIDEKLAELAKTPGSEDKVAALKAVKEAIPQKPKKSRLVYKDDKITGYTKEHAKKAVSDLFPNAKEEDLLGAFNAVGKGKVKIEANEKGFETGYEEGRVDDLFDSSGMEAGRSFYRDKDTGKVVCKNNIFMIGEDSPHKGQGYKIFQNQVESLQKLGVSKITTYAEGRDGDEMNGYYTWARLGYEGMVDPDILAKMPKDVQSKMGESLSLRDLMDIPGGAESWKKHGETTNMEFDLTPGSRSMKALAAYVKDRESRR